MNCLNRSQLEQFLKGELEPALLIAAAEHVETCGNCASEIAGRMASSSACAALSEALLGVEDCPDYETLSAYVETSLPSEVMTLVSSHTGRCELCAADIARMQELRSHAALREKLVLGPTPRSVRHSGRAVWLRRVFAGAVAAGVVIGLMVTVPQMKKPTKVVSTPSVEAKREDVTPPAVATRQPDAGPSSVRTEKTVVAAAPEATPERPAVASLLSDGPYSVARVNGKIVLARKDGTSATTALEAKLAESIAAKLRTGKIRQARPVQMAMASIALRDGESYVPPPTAPRLVTPVARITVQAVPSFTWSKVDLADSYRIVVTDAGGNVVLDATTKNHSFSPARPLQRGRVYTWRVGVRFGPDDEWSNSSAARFGVLSSEDLSRIQQVKRLLPDSRIALGVAYESAGLYEEASAQYRALRARHPESALARQMLNGVPER